MHSTSRILLRILAGGGHDDDDDGGHHGEEHGEHAHDEIAVFAPIFLLTMGAVVRTIQKASHDSPNKLMQLISQIPYTVILLLLGAVIGFGLRVGWEGRVADSHRFIDSMQPHLLLHVFLPPLIFESAFSIEWHIFNKVKTQMLILAGPGMLVSTFALGAIINALMAGFFAGDDEHVWPRAAGNLLGGILSATDPVAVVALLKDVGVKADLSTAIEGESLLNDGTALVVFLVILEAVQDTSFSPGAVHIVSEFVRMSIGGVAFGLFIGACCIVWLSYIFNDALVEITITVAASYLAFFVSEVYFEVSGVLAVVALGLFMGMVGRTRISPEVQHFLKEFWELLAFFGNTLVFCIAGMVVATRELAIIGDDWLILLIVYIACLVVRFFTVFGTGWFLQACGTPQNPKDLAVSTWGGLRGAVGLALALIVAEDEEISRFIGDRVLLHTCGIVVLTVVVNGVTMRYLISALGMDRISVPRQRVFEQAMSSLRKAGQLQETALRRNVFYGGALWDEVRRFYFVPPVVKVEGRMVKLPRATSSDEDPNDSFGSDPGQALPGLGTDMDGSGENDRDDAHNSSGARRRSASDEALFDSTRAVSATKAAVKEARRRVLMICKSSYWTQFKDGLLGQHALKRLMHATERAIDDDCCLNEWEELSEHLHMDVDDTPDNATARDFVRALSTPRTLKRQPSQFVSPTLAALCAAINNPWTLLCLLCLGWLPVIVWASSSSQAADITLLMIMIVFVTELILRFLVVEDFSAILLDFFFCVDIVTASMVVWALTGTSLGSAGFFMGTLRSVRIFVLYPKLKVDAKAFWTYLAAGSRKVMPALSGSIDDDDSSIDDARSANTDPGDRSAPDEDDIRHMPVRVPTRDTDRSHRDSAGALPSYHALQEMQRLWSSSDSTWLQRLRVRIQASQLQIGFDVAAGFLAAREECMHLLSDMFRDSEKQFATIKSQLQKDIRLVRTALFDMQHVYSEIAASVTTSMAARTVLNKQRREVERLEHEGILECTEAERIRGAVEYQMKRLQHKPPVVRPPTREQLISQIAWLEAVPPEAMHEVFLLFQDVYYEKNTPIARLGDDEDAVYVIARGTAAVVTADGHTVANLGMGSALGEMAWATKEPRGADIVTTSPVLVLKIEGRTLHRLALRFPVIREELWLVAGKRMAENMWIRDLATKQTLREVREQLAHYYMTLVRKPTEYTFKRGAMVFVVRGSASEFVHKGKREDTHMLHMDVDHSKPDGGHHHGMNTHYHPHSATMHRRLAGSNGSASTSSGSGAGLSMSVAAPIVEVAESPFSRGHKSPMVDSPNRSKIQPEGVGLDTGTGGDPDADPAAHTAEGGKVVGTEDTNLGPSFDEMEEQRVRDQEAATCESDPAHRGGGHPSLMRLESLNTDAQQTCIHEAPCLIHVSAREEEFTSHVFAPGSRFLSLPTDLSFRRFVDQMANDERADRLYSMSRRLSDSRLGGRKVSKFNLMARRNSEASSVRGSILRSEGLADWSAPTIPNTVGPRRSTVAHASRSCSHSVLPGSNHVPDSEAYISNQQPFSQQHDDDHHQQQSIRHTIDGAVDPATLRAHHPSRLQISIPPKLRKSKTEAVV